MQKAGFHTMQLIFSQIGKLYVQFVNMNIFTGIYFCKFLILAKIVHLLLGTELKFRCAFNIERQIANFLSE